MAKRRNLKQDIQIVTSNLLCEAYVVYGLLKHLTDEEFTTIVEEIAATNNDFLSRVNHPEPGVKAKAYYRQLCSDFEAKTDEIFQKMNKQ